MNFSVTEFNETRYAVSRVSFIHLNLEHFMGRHHLGD